MANQEARIRQGHCADQHLMPLRHRRGGQRRLLNHDPTSWVLVDANSIVGLDPSLPFHAKSTADLLSTCLWTRAIPNLS